MSLRAAPSGTVIIGGGPAGLTAGYALSRAGHPVTLLEANPVRWGGISRTEEYRGYRFDIGGHRFFSKSARIEALWDEILPEPMLERPRKSRIFYKRRLFSYPIRGFEALRNLGAVEAVRCVTSYAVARARPITPVRSFEDWVTNAFGRRLFEIFFKTYTEKVWGMPCSEISADWAAQRIKGLSLGSAIWHAVVPARFTSRGETVKTLIPTFRYPRLGPGMMWDAAAAHIAEAGGALHRGLEVTAISAGAADGQWLVTATGRGGSPYTFHSDNVISSMPLRELVNMLDPAPPEHVRSAADRLRYRDFVTVALIVQDRDRFDDNWIYIHEPGVSVGRIQNFKSWSPALVPEGTTACYGLEYFCHEGDGLWEMADGELVKLAAREMASLGLMDEEDLLDGAVVRQPKAYPVYDDEYERNVAVIRQYLEDRHPTLHLVGRNGMHKYNNQDHAMITALLTAENIIAGKRMHNVWKVNQDAEYHEEASGSTSQAAGGLRVVPRPISE